MQRNRLVISVGCLVASFVPGLARAGLTPGPGYQVQYQINGAHVSAIDRVSDTQLAATVFNGIQDVTTVALNNGPVGPTIYTQPALPSGLTFGGGFIAADGTYALTGQTGYPPDAQGLTPGRLFLTRLSDGTTSELGVAGNFDAATVGGEFYVTAAAGTATGVSNNGAGGIYQVQRTGGTLGGLHLIIDTGTPSGLVAGDSAGNVAFSLGGVSPTLGGGFSDLYRLSSAQIASALSGGPTTGLPPGAADKLINGTALFNAAEPFFSAHTPAGGSVFPALSDLLLMPSGDIIVGLTGILFDKDSGFAGSVGQALLLDVTSNGADYSANVAGIVYTHDENGAGSLAYRESDATLWVSDAGNLYALSLVPEPGTLLLLALGTAVMCPHRDRRDT